MQLIVLGLGGMCFILMIGALLTGAYLALIKQEGDRAITAFKSSSFFCGLGVILIFLGLGIGGC